MNIVLLEIHVYGPAMYIDKFYVNSREEALAKMNTLAQQHGGVKERNNERHVICNDAAQVEQ